MYDLTLHNVPATNLQSASELGGSIEDAAENSLATAGFGSRRLEANVVRLRTDTNYSRIFRQIIFTFFFAVAICSK